MNTAPVPIAEPQLSWLQGESERWTAAGIISGDQAERLLAGYRLDPTATRTSRRIGMATLLLTLGACFVGVGIIWLIAANLDQLPPLVRFLAVLTFWLTALLGGEWLAGRRAHGGAIASPVVGAARLLAALLAGGVIFQAAQSLQVPAYSPSLVGWWALIALSQAYAVAAIMPLLVGLVAGVVWLIWAVGVQDDSPYAVAVTLGAVAVVATGVSALHRGRLRQFAAPWREIGAALALGVLFAAAVPAFPAEPFYWTWQLVLVLVLGAALTLWGLVRGGPPRWELVAAAAMLAGSIALILWETSDDPTQLGLAEWGHAGLAVAGYVGAALWVAILGIRHSSWRLTGIATAALVQFTTFQSFAVFAAIIQGAWLFVVLGIIFVGTGYAFDRARRELVQTLEA